MNLLDRLLAKQDELTKESVDIKEGRKPREPDVSTKEPGQKEIKDLTEEEKKEEEKEGKLPDVHKTPDAKEVQKLTEQPEDEPEDEPEDFEELPDDVSGEGSEDELPEEEPEAAIEESPFPDGKEYFGKKEDTYYYIVGVKSDEDDREDLQIQDQEEKMIYSCKEKGVDISDTAMAIVEIVKELDVEEISYDVFVKYILPKLEEKEEEEEEFGEEEIPPEGEETPVESKNASEKKKPPICKKCGKRHWPFQPCPTRKGKKGVSKKKPKKKSKKESVEAKLVFDKKDFEAVSKGSSIFINGEKFPLSKDTIGFYKLKESSDLKDLVNDMLRAMTKKQIRELAEGYGERGERDGTGPYKDSAQRSVSDVGLRKQAGEECPYEDKRWVYGTRTGLWYLVGPEDRDYEHGLTHEEKEQLSDEEAKERYLRPRRVESKLKEGGKKKSSAKVRHRGDCVFPSTSSKVTDNKDHFPINNVAQARNALARANQYSSNPSWHKGSLKSLVTAVANAVSRKYKSIEVTKASRKPGKESIGRSNKAMKEQEELGNEGGSTGEGGVYHWRIDGYNTHGIKGLLSIGLGGRETAGIGPDEYFDGSVEELFEEFVMTDEGKKLAGGSVEKIEVEFESEGIPRAVQAEFYGLAKRCDIKVNENKKSMGRFSVDEKEAIMKNDKKTITEKRKHVDEDLSGNVKELQRSAEQAVKDGDYIKAAELVNRLSAVEGSVGELPEKPESEEELEVEARPEEKEEEMPEEEEEEIPEEEEEETPEEDVEEKKKDNPLGFDEKDRGLMESIFSNSRLIQEDKEKEGDEEGIKKRGTPEKIERF